MARKPPAGSVGLTLAAAEKAAARGHDADAEALCRRVLDGQPDNVEALLLLGEIAARTERVSLAQRLLRTVIARDPDAVDAYVRLAGLLRPMGGQEEGIALCRRATALDPGSADAWFVLGISCIDRWRVAEAITALTKAAELRRDGASFDRLGYALQLEGRDDDAVIAYRRAIELDPDVLNSYIDLGRLLTRRGETVEAERLYDQADQAAWSSVDQLMAVARSHRTAGKLVRAEAALRRAMDLDGEAGAPRLLLSQIMQQAGRFAEARSVLEETISHHPGQYKLYHELAFGGKISPADQSLVDSMLEIVKNASLSPEERVQVHYSLGKAFDDLGDYEQAIAHFHSANRISYDSPLGVFRNRKAYSELIDSVISTFTPAFIEEYRGLGNGSEKPAFIFGLPRSGTTLAEQILSSHSEVGAVGELTYLSNSAPPLNDRQWRPEAEEMRRLAEGYLRVVESMTKGEARVTDKMPNNFLMAGLIRILFPNARMIHCRRNPIDTCLSIYTTPIVVAFSHSLPDLAFAYREYERLMTHWRSIFPPNRFFELDYEALVANPEPVERRLIEFLGLPWEDAVRRHEGNRRSVQTASVWQVRQPIHTGSVERWRRYKPWIGDLLAEFPDLATAPH